MSYIVEVTARDPICLFHRVDDMFSWIHGTADTRDLAVMPATIAKVIRPGNYTFMSCITVNSISAHVYYNVYDDIRIASSSGFKYRGWCIVKSY